MPSSQYNGENEKTQKNLPLPGSLESYFRYALQVEVWFGEDTKNHNMVGPVSVTKCQFFVGLKNQLPGCRPGKSVRFSSDPDS